MPPDSEWDAISLNYTSGTTGNPKGVVYHHRGAYLNAIANSCVWGMKKHPIYLWTLPMFHCNGWCFPCLIFNTIDEIISSKKVLVTDINQNNYFFENSKINLKINEIVGKEVFVDFEDSFFGNKNNDPALRGSGICIVRDIIL